MDYYDYYNAPVVPPSPPVYRPPVAPPVYPPRKSQVGLWMGIMMILIAGVIVLVGMLAISLPNNQVDRKSVSYIDGYRAGTSYVSGCRGCPGTRACVTF